MSDTIKTQTDGHVGIVTLNRPKVLNALSYELMDALIEALERFDGDSDIHVIVLTGNERAFAAGADIGNMAEASFLDMYNDGSCTVIGVEFDCNVDADCDNSNDCTIETCVNNTCTFSNAASGAACDDGLFCTATSECDGAGTCVGSGSPCPPKYPVCCELTGTCVAVGEACPAPT